MTPMIAAIATRPGSGTFFTFQISPTVTSAIRLRQRQSFLVILVGDPVAPLHEIAIHVSDERDRTTKAHAAQFQEIERKLGGRVRSTFGHRGPPAGICSLPMPHREGSQRSSLPSANLG